MFDGIMKYDFTGIDTLVADIKYAQTRLTESHEQLEGRIKALGATWYGSNNEAYEAVQAKWNTSHNDLLNTLTQIAMRVDKNNAAIQGTEAGLRQGWVGNH